MGFPLTPLVLTVGRIGFQEDRQRFQLENGTRERWDPVLRPSPVLRGRVVTTEGRAVSGWALRGSRGGVTATRTITTAEDGSFEFLLSGGAEASEPVDLELYLPNLPRRPSHRWTSITPDSEPQELRVPGHALGAATLQARLRTAEGEVPADLAYLSATVPHERSRLRGTVNPRTGSLELGPVPLGEYDLRIVRSRSGDFLLPGVALTTAGPHDLGVISLPPQGELQLVLQPPGIVEQLADTPADQAALWLRIVQDGRTVDWIENLDSDGASLELHEGRYQVKAGGPVLRAEVEFTIHAGEPAEVRLDLEPAVFCDFTFTVPNDEATPQRVELSLSGSTAVPEVPEVRLWSSRQHEEELRTAVALVGSAEVGLRPGHYRLQALTDTGLRAVLEFDAQTPGSTAEHFVHLAR